MRARLSLAALAAALLAGCGGATKPTLLRGPHSCVPAEGAGTMGSCSPKPKLQLTRASLAGPKVPDVSYFQGTVNWTVARPHISGAIVRVADGNFNDPAFPRNWRELRRLHIWHATYFFVRPGNCAAEADRAVGLVNAQGGFDSGPLIADAEVPLNYGCAAAFVAEAKRRTGLAEVIYTAPGTWAGGPHGNALLWVASYGPSPGCVWTCSHVAWQYTDGQVGPYPRCIPGIGCDDISTDNGITKLGAVAKPASLAAKRLALARERRAIHSLHRLIDRHHCRPGDHATPRRFHTVCGYWLRHGDTHHRNARRLERELRRHP